VPAAIALALAALLLAKPGHLGAQDQGAVPIKGPLTVTLNAYPTMGPAPLTVGFYPTIIDPEGSPIAMYTFRFGDGSQTSGPPVAVTLKTYPKPGSYVASLTVVAEDGRTATGFAGINVGMKAN